MNPSFPKTPVFPPSFVRPVATICLLAVASSLLTGCSQPQASDSTPAPSSGAAEAPTPSLKQQVENAPDVPAAKKQQIADSLARTQQAANDPRAMRGRPSPTPH